MTDLVERLRGFKSAAAKSWADEAADEIESLRTKLAECQKEREDWMVKAAKFAFELTAAQEELRLCQQDAIKLQDQLAECQKEHVDHELSFKIIESGAAAQARIAELVEALKGTLPYASMYGHKALSRTDNMEALNDYRNSVIEECAAKALFIDMEPFRGVSDAIRALKKGE